MIKKFRQNKTIWFDLINPSESELKDIFQELKLDPFKDLRQGNPLPFVIKKEKYLITKCLLLNIKQSPNSFYFNINHLENKTIIGDGFIITIHSEPLSSFEELENIFDKKLNISKKNQEIIIFSKIIFNVYKKLEKIISDINYQLEKIGQIVLDDNDSISKLIKIEKFIKEIENNIFHQTKWLENLKIIKILIIL